MAEAEAASNSTGVSPKEQRARTPQKPRLRNTAQMVTLYCGQSPEAIPHLVHKDFAIHYSPVLKAAFASPFIEGQTQVYRFEDTTDGALQYLVNWIYTQDVVVPRSIEELAKDKSLMDAECMILCDLWVLADKMRMPQLQNKVMDELNQINIQTVRCPTGCIPYVWDNTAKGSLLRLWFLKHYAYFLNRSHLNVEKLPIEMITELGAMLLGSFPIDARLKEKEAGREVSQYHVAIPEGE